MKLEEPNIYPVLWLTYQLHSSIVLASPNQERCPIALNNAQNPFKNMVPTMKNLCPRQTKHKGQDILLSLFDKWGTKTRKN